MSVLRKTLASLVFAFAVPSMLGAGPAKAAPVKTDFVFMIDATSSMSGEIAGVRAGFASFVAGLSAATVDARFAVVVFGGAPELTLDFTSDGTAAQTALNNIVIGSNAFQNNHNVNPEAGLEAIRMALGAAADSTFANDHIAGTGALSFRSDARINLILVTDEDSDRGGNSANWLTGQTTNDPPSTLNAAWQAEVDEAAAAIIAKQAYINMLINIADSPTKEQYGDYTKDVADADLLNFDPDATLTALLADSLTDDSLQAQVLAAGLIGRSFDVAGANDSDFVNNFFAAKLQEVIKDPGVIPSAPEPGTLVILSLGLAGLGLMRRKRAA